MSTPSTLYIFSGLPGVGKTTLAKALANSIKATYLRIDTIEQGIRDLCDFKVEGEGYRLAYKIASDNLLLGNNVIADSCNPIKLTRNEWQEVAVTANASFVNIEIICSIKEIHKQRATSRSSDIPNLNLPRWQNILEREYDEWIEEHIIIDTSEKTPIECFDELKEKLKVDYRYKKGHSIPSDMRSNFPTCR
ncbi:AAA family ATPase [Desulfogranum japonicum]|uniref:AAA family ATPase n=1 Tax=Desulfogranum japonicum TaxID=231447 RepID=UPI00055847B0|nr:AAA family ATPase [Desulfogranum japonicum]